MITLVAVACISEGNFADRYSEALCDKLDSCGPNPIPDCKNTLKAGADETLDMCDDYKGGLAHKCVKEIEDLACDDAAADLPACEDFDDACGISEQGIEIAPGVQQRGLSVTWSEPASP